MIPKIIHLCWLSEEKYPEEIKKCIDSMHAFLPDYEFRIWTNKNFDIEAVLWVKEAYQAGKYAFAADYIRFWCLYHYGGIYLDCDVELLKSFDPLLDNKSFIGFEYLNIPEAAVIGAEKGVHWVKKCLDWYEGKSFYYETGEMKKQIVPHLVKLVIENTISHQLFDVDRILFLCDVTIYPFYYFSPKNYFSGKVSTREDTVAIHRFASAWGPGKKKKWTLVVHQFFIFLLGKQIHDKVYMLIKKKILLFNGDSI